MWRLLTDGMPRKALLEFLVCETEEEPRQAAVIDMACLTRGWGSCGLQVRLKADAFVPQHGALSRWSYSSAISSRGSKTFSRQSDLRHASQASQGCRQRGEDSDKGMTQTEALSAILPGRGRFGRCREHSALDEIRVAWQWRCATSFEQDGQPVQVDEEEPEGLPFAVPCQLRARRLMILTGTTLMRQELSPKSHAVEMHGAVRLPG